MQYSNANVQVTTPLHHYCMRVCCNLEYWALSHSFLANGVFLHYISPMIMTSHLSPGAEKSQMKHFRSSENRMIHIVCFTLCPSNLSF